MESLPQELKDIIIDCLPPGDMGSFRNCSVVAKSWINASRKRLFESVRTGPRNLLPWLDRISQENVDLLRHVRELTCFQEFSATEQALQDTPPDHFRFLRQLRHLNLGLADISLSSKEIGSFHAFKFTLSSINLVMCRISRGTLIALINYFPNLEILCLVHLFCRKPSDKIPLLPRPPLKRLHIDDGLPDFLDLLNDLSGLGLRVDEVIFKPTNPSQGFVNRVASAFGANLQCLRLPRVTSSMCNPTYSYREIPTHDSLIDRESLTLSPCHELRELEFEISAYPLNGNQLDFVLSVTSTKIERIIIYRSRKIVHPVGDAVWTRLDSLLTELAERLVNGIRLEVEFRGSWDVGENEFEQKKVRLPGFIEKGRITLWSCDNELVYCSDVPEAMMYRR